MINRLAITVIQSALIPLLSPLFAGLIRTLKARLQNRQGPDIFQSYRDLRKLFSKDEVINKDASWIFKAVPYVIFSITALIGSGLPLVTTYFKSSVAGDFLVTIYLLAAATFFLALAGIDSGNAFGGFGSSREMTLSALAEAGLMFSLLVLAILAHSANLSQIAESISGLPLFLFMPVLVAFMGFILALLAETGRLPFDNPATHLELTMIHEAMILEYSGRRLALIEWASANKLMIFLCLAANLFLPWGISSTLAPAAVIIAGFALFAKLTILCAAIAVLESTTAKFRFFRLPDLLFASFVISIIALGISL